MTSSKEFNLSCKKAARHVVFCWDHFPPDSIERHEASRVLMDIITVGNPAFQSGSPEGAYEFFVEDARHHPDRGYWEMLSDNRGVYFVRLPEMTFHRSGETLDTAICTLPAVFGPLLGDREFRTSLIQTLAEAREGGFQLGMGVGRWQKTLEDAGPQLAEVETQPTTARRAASNSIPKPERTQERKLTQLHFDFDVSTQDAGDQVR